MTLLGDLRKSRERHPFGQFGTAGDGCTDNGALGCTHAVWRFIAFVYTGRWYSHDELTKFSGYPCGGGSTNRGMRPSESQALCKRLGLPLVFRSGMSAGDLLRASAKGPCMVAIRYGDWPTWQGYGGKSWPRPYARPLGKAGRNQTGFTGSHAVALLGYERIVAAGGKFLRNDAYVFEPNHDSASRPENVPYDIVTQTEFGIAYRAVVAKLRWPATVAFVPTRAPKFPGGL